MRGIGIAQNERDGGNRMRAVDQQLDGPFLPELFQQIVEREVAVRKVTLQRTHTHIEGIRYHTNRRAAVLDGISQHLNDCLADFGLTVQRKSARLRTRMRSASRKMTWMAILAHH